MPGRRRDCLLPGNDPGGPPGRAEEDEQGGGEPRRPVPLPCQGAGCPRGAGKGLPNTLLQWQESGQPGVPPEGPGRACPKGGARGRPRTGWAGGAQPGAGGRPRRGWPGGGQPGQEAGPAEAGQVGPSPGQEAGPSEAGQVGPSPGQEAGPAEAGQVGPTPGQEAGQVGASPGSDGLGLWVSAPTPEERQEEAGGAVIPPVDEEAGLVHRRVGRGETNPSPPPQREPRGSGMAGQGRVRGGGRLSLDLLDSLLSTGHTLTLITLAYSTLQEYFPD
ncbi:collagen alpha-1(I) chain-like [Portunus trituberculatus]|uniref:collagen alpha-1(I) chain-like n=1 Tax=Portunus trituberculatus TaxID=210409 RepID=UPI001E1CC6D4|nr:collagen alpha-1(I) chain-like [Portunus trituberculatus]